MTQQPITTELRRWIVAQAEAGHPPDIVLDAMKASGWDEAVAIAAILPEPTMKKGGRNSPISGSRGCG
ncbi:MAG: hypothetical protein ACXWUL_07015 [Caldimonas sp.]